MVRNRSRPAKDSRGFGCRDMDARFGFHAPYINCISIEWPSTVTDKEQQQAESTTKPQISAIFIFTLYQSCSISQPFFFLQVVCISRRMSNIDLRAVPLLRCECGGHLKEVACEELIDLLWTFTYSTFCPLGSRKKLDLRIRLTSFVINGQTVQQ
ncbi:hypothetical protein CEXT_642251 [Caerostris extrusa]|uniref:Uncharacterized protein n=1 Tax=Caerostris extrusa TaxID=172846 RepID=A0AAV4WEU9_CAEEX|nr:hypothetical protein CEXT_642251 [Caerostris extrusa]